MAEVAAGERGEGDLGMHLEHPLLEAGLDLEDLLAECERLRRQRRQNLPRLRIARREQRRTRRGRKDAAASRTDERARRDIGGPQTLVGETDRDIDPHRCRTRKAVEQLYEPGGEERVREPPVL